tara:strand:- start:13051 stop:13458 length:408 start_codon:yes stop_codon:yes gene_type:complete
MSEIVSPSVSAARVSISKRFETAFASNCSIASKVHSSNLTAAAYFSLELSTAAKTCGSSESQSKLSGLPLTSRMVKLASLIAFKASFAFELLISPFTQAEQIVSTDWHRSKTSVRDMHGASPPFSSLFMSQISEN